VSSLDDVKVGLRKLGESAGNTSESPMFVTDEQHDLYVRRNKWSWAHGNPNSMLITPIGSMWEDGAYYHTKNMMMGVRKAGFMAWLAEINDSYCTAPYANLSAMRDDAMLRAQTLGVEWLLLIETDALPEPDTALKLVAAEAPVIAPIIIHPKTERGLGIPGYAAGVGVKPVRWVPTTMLLIRAGVLRCPEVRFGTTTTEGEFFRRLAHYNHQAFIHTDVILPIARPPSDFPLLPWGKRQELFAQVDAKRRQIPNRRSLLPNDPREIEGVYSPELFE